MDFILSTRLKNALNGSTNVYLRRLANEDYGYPASCFFEVKKRRSYIDFVPDDGASISYVTFGAYNKVDLCEVFEKATKTVTRAGKFFKWLFPDFGDTVIQKITEDYTSMVSLILTESSKYAFELVKGDDIRKFYREENHDTDCQQYAMDTLGKSCMRHHNLGPLFDIYVKNPEHINMLIYKNCDNNRIVGRAILWVKAVKGINFMDRVYGDNNIRALFVAYAREQGWYTKMKQDYNSCTDFQNSRGKIERIKIDLDIDCNHESAPYFDTFYCTDRKRAIRNYQTNNNQFYEMQQQHGGFSHLQMVRVHGGGIALSPECVRVNDIWYRREDCIEVLNYKGERVLNRQENAHFSNQLGEYLLQEHAVWVNSIQDYLYSGHPDFVMTDEGKFHKLEVILAKCKNGIFRLLHTSRVKYSVFAECYVNKSMCYEKVHNGIRDNIHNDDMKEYEEFITQEVNQEVEQPMVV